eukprot:gene13410-13524_t
MADYYQLISRAVNGLPTNSPEARDAIYERARAALSKQLRSLQPPIAETDIQRESKSLEEAIARTELDAASASLNFALNPAPQPAPPPISDFIKPVAEPVKDEIKPSPQAQLAARPVPPPPAETVTEETAAESSKLRESSHPAAPKLETNQKSNARLLIMAAAAFLVVAGVAGTALWLKQNPDDPARKPKIDGVATTEVKPAPGKNTERANGPAVPPVTTITPAKPTANDQTAGAQPAVKSGQNITVATRSALLLEAPDEPTKVKTYIGTVVWSTTSKTTANGTFVIMHGDVTVPDADFKFTLNLQKNDDPKFPADLLMDLRFTAGAQNKLPPIKELAMPEMRQEETARGEPLKGGVVAITPLVYMVGLSQVDRDKIRNAELLAQREWFDIPLILTDGRAAKLTIEKGIAGSRALADALK